MPNSKPNSSDEMKEVSDEIERMRKNLIKIANRTAIHKLMMSFITSIASALVFIGIGLGLSIGWELGQMILR